MTTTTTRTPHLSAVRVGNGTVVHAGHLSILGTPDAPRYIPSCPAGAPRFPRNDDNAPRVIPNGAPVTDRVTCRNCVRNHSAAVATIHAAQDTAAPAQVEPEPAAEPVAQVEPSRLSAVRTSGTDVHAGRIVAGGYVPARYVPVCGSGGYPAWGVACTDRITCHGCHRGHGYAVDAIHAAQDGATMPAGTVHPVSLNTPAGVLDGPAAQRLRAELLRDPAAVWQMIRDAGRDAITSPARRLRRAWMHAALRDVYGLPPVAHDGISDDGAELVALRAADTRDADTRARLYLAAYAAQLDDRAETVDRLALRFAAPDDDAQVSAGDRPAVGSWVTVEGQPGRWEVVRRSPVEQRRDPRGIRVKAEGHTLNAAVPVAAVTSCPAPGTDTRVSGWQAVQTGFGDDRDGIGEWSVYAVNGGAYLGELWRNAAGEWSAHRIGYGPHSTATGHASRAEALAAVDWLDTVAAGSLGDVAPVRVILADGSTMHVERTAVEPTDAAGRVTVDMFAVGERFELGDPRPVEALAGRGRVGDECMGPSRSPSYALTFWASDRVALFPPCPGCGARAGDECTGGCTGDVA